MECFGKTNKGLIHLVFADNDKEVFFDGLDGFFQSSLELDTFSLASILTVLNGWIGSRNIKSTDS